MINIKKFLPLDSLLMPIDYRYLCAIFFLFIAACTSTTVVKKSDREQEIKANPTELKHQVEEKDYPVAPFPPDILYQLLLAEIAGHRSQLNFSLEKYLYAANETRDPGVAARATRLALYLKNYDAALKAVAVWSQVEPNSLAARSHAMDLLIRQGDLEKAIPHIQAIKDLGGKASFASLVFRAADVPAKNIPPILAALSETAEKHPKDKDLLFSLAVFLERGGELAEALLITERLLAELKTPNFVALKVNILNAMKLKDDAIAYLVSMVETLKPSRRLELMLARLLFEKGNLDKAKDQYSKILKTFPNDGDVLLALALISLEQGNDLKAKEHLERMVRWDQRSGEAHYYLGGIAERQKNPEMALREFNMAGAGYEFIPAQARIAAILADQDKWEEARDNLTKLRKTSPVNRQQLIIIEARLLADRDKKLEAIAFLTSILRLEPENIDLLYARAMIGQESDQLKILEADLRKIIEIDPDNADALNALGYTLADKTDRNAEALELIERALEIKPNEAAFLDSFGWVQYRLENFESAVSYLRKALELLQNDEIAAHLGEVLWVTGNKVEAQEVWKRALKLSPKSEILMRVIQEFKDD